MAAYEFSCASPVCNTRLTAPTKEEVIARMTEHVRTDHRVPRPTRPILQFLTDHAIVRTTGAGS